MFVIFIKLICVALITYLLELPVTMIMLHKYYKKSFINVVTLLINVCTNIVLNGVILPILYLNNIEQVIINYCIIVIEVLIIIVEFGIYVAIFKNKIKISKLFIMSLIANIISYSTGFIWNYIKQITN